MILGNYQSHATNAVVKFVLDLSPLRFKSTFVDKEKKNGFKLLDIVHMVYYG